MTTLHERKRTFENLFAHDEELRFKVHARCAKTLAKWAAEKMKLTEEEVKNYADICVDIGTKADGMHKLAIKVHDDMKVNGVALAKLRDIKARVQSCLREAKKLIMEEKPLD